MNTTLRILVVSFLECFASVCVQRGLYFFSHDRLGFSDVTNLWVALTIGVTSVTGAMVSHRLAKWAGERRLLVASIGSEVLLFLMLAGWPGMITVFGCSAILGLLSGVKWPVIESYVSAGKTPAQQARAIGQFNVAWASSVPVALAAVGPMIGAWGGRAAASLFLVPSAMNLLCLALVAGLRERPLHLPADHVARPKLREATRLRALLLGNRWLMLASYCMVYMLAPLFPTILESVGAKVTWAPAVSGALDIVKLGAFFLLGQWAAWHGRASPVLGALVLMPAAFFLILFGGSLSTIIVGECLFGVCSGMVYYGSLYYAMVVKNAAVEGGGAHESLIALGYVVGPIAGLLGVTMEPAIGTLTGLHSSALVKVLAAVVTIGPVVAICSVAAIRPLIRAIRIFSRRG